MLLVLETAIKKGECLNLMTTISKLKIPTGLHLRALWTVALPI